MSVLTQPTAWRPDIGGAAQPPRASPASRSLRVLFVTDYLHLPQGGGGAERNTHELCLSLKALGDQPAVSCFLQNDGSWLFWASRVRRRLPPRREYARDTVCGYPVFRGWDHARVAGNLLRFRADVIILQSTRPERLLDALAPSGTPIVAYFHEVEEIDHLAALRGTDVPIIANSAFTAARLAERCGLQSKVVLPLVEARHYRAVMRPERVLFINTTERKGVHLAFTIAERRPDIPFDFVLSWTHKPDALHALRARARAAGNIHLHSPTQDMRRLYARAKLLLAPSQWQETWGRVATEAQINGIPVLGSNRGGLPQAIGPGGIILPATASPEVWTAALSRLWDDPAAHAAAAAAARAHAARPDIQPATIIANLRDVLIGAIQGATWSERGVG